MAGPQYSLDRCRKCGREFDSFPMLLHGATLNLGRRPIDFVCKACGALLGQSGLCTCGNCHTSLRNNPGNDQPPVCLVCGEVPMEGAIMHEL